MNMNNGFICINPSFQGFIQINPSFEGATEITQFNLARPEKLKSLRLYLFQQTHLQMFLLQNNIEKNNKTNT